MPDNKLTDNEIIKALKEVLELMCNEGDLQKSATISNTLDLINRLQAENSNLQEKNLNLTSDLTSLQKDLTSLQAYDERLQEAIDEQDIEIARLWKEIERYKKYYFAHKYDKWEKEIKAEAYKECIEKVKEYYKNKLQNYQFNYDAYCKLCEELDNILKELVGE